MTALPLIIAAAVFANGHTQIDEKHGITYRGGTVQLLERANMVGASVNGVAVTLKAPPLQIAGRTFVPLTETLSFFGLALGYSTIGRTVGKLEFPATMDAVTLDGSPMPVESNLIKRGDITYISAKLLADGIDARLRAGEHGEFYLTMVRAAADDPLLPQPRFTTDKDVYDIGEPVKIEEFSFDPLGENIGLHWTNRQAAYFKPGPVTIDLEATNAARKGNKMSRAITIRDHVMNTPLDFSLKYGEVGDLIEDSSLDRPTLPRTEAGNAGARLFFSDSPEVVDRMGMLYKETFQGRCRLVGYHINGASTPSRLCLVVKNVDTVASTVRVERMGDTAPERIEGVLGQVTLMGFLTDHDGAKFQLEPGESSLVYASPTLAEHAGASLMADIGSDHRTEISLAMTAGETTLSAEAITALSELDRDTNHARGTFPTATRSFSLDLGSGLPAKAIIGDPIEDPAEVGEDPITHAKVTLDGNYGVTYAITLHNARGVVAAIAPRGGVYKGAVVVEDPATGERKIVRLPRYGVLANPDQPMIFLRSKTSVLKLEFIPASGSGLPVHLVFYRPSGPI